MPLGLSGIAFATSAFFFKYQYLFLGLAIGSLGLAYFMAWKTKSWKTRSGLVTLSLSTAMTIVSVAYLLYVNYGF